MNGSATSLIEALQLPGVDRFGPEGDEPVYALPPPAIHVLASPRGQTGRRWFEPEQIQAELAFTQHCEEWNCVGYQSQGPIQYHLLTRRSVDVSSSLFVSMGWSTSQARAIEGLEQDASEATQRLRGVAGWLLTEPTFLHEVSEVRSLSLAICPSNRPRFPLGRILMAPGSMSAAESRFGRALSTLLDRWGLMFLASWGLPAPQGPLLPDFLPPTAPARPAHGIHVYVPMHYPLQGDDEIQARIAEFQRQAARDLGIPPSLAGLAHFETYERMFRILHLERAISRRFPESPRGLVAVIETVASEAFHLSIDRVKRLRKDIAKCLAGNRQQIRALRAAH